MLPRFELLPCKREGPAQAGLFFGAVRVEYGTAHAAMAKASSDAAYTLVCVFRASARYQPS